MLLCGPSTACRCTTFEKRSAPCEFDVLFKIYVYISPFRVKSGQVLVRYSMVSVTGYGLVRAGGCTFLPTV